MSTVIPASEPESHESIVVFGRLRVEPAMTDRGVYCNDYLYGFDHFGALRQMNPDTVRLIAMPLNIVTKLILS